jgi:hypothetical protein
MNQEKSVITLTFGDMAENHVGMEQIGDRVEIGHGFNLEDLKQIKKTFTNINLKPKIYKLHEFSPELKKLNLPQAYLLVIPNGIEKILNENSGYNITNLSDEQAKLNWDKKALMYGRVVNKNARYNLCFDIKGHSPDYEEGKGRVISYNKIPITKILYDNMEKYFGEKGNNLKCEGNFYYDKDKCGIGFHGDSERRKVIAFRLGATLNMHYQWFLNGEDIGSRIIIPVYGGDIYVMSEKAVGTDWKKKEIYTLRHATGSSKFTEIKS